MGQSTGCPCTLPDTEMLNILNRNQHKKVSPVDAWAYAIEPHLALSLVTGGLPMVLDNTPIENPGQVLIYSCDYETPEDRVSAGRQLDMVDLALEDVPPDVFWGYANVESQVDYTDAPERFAMDALLHGCGQNLEEFKALRGWGEVIGYRFNLAFELENPILVQVGPENRGWFKATAPETLEAFKQVLNNTKVNRYAVEF